MNQNTGAIYPDLATAVREDPEPEALVAVHRAFARLPQRARPAAYRAMTARGKAARLLRGQNSRGGR